MTVPRDFSSNSSNEAELSVFNDLDAGVILIDCDSSAIVDINPAALQLMQAKREEIIGVECGQFFRSAYCYTPQCPIHDPATRNCSFDCQLVMGNRAPVNLRKNSTKIRLGEKTYLLETFVNLDDRKQAEQYLYDQQTLAEALSETANVINQSLNLREVLYLILNVIGKVVPHDSANIMLLENDMARMTAWRGYDKLKGIQLSEQPRRIDEVPNLQRMAETGLPIVVPNTKTSADWVNLASSTWINSYVSAPIRRNGKILGFLNLNSSQPGFYSDLHAERLLAFANQAAIAIENARLYERAQQELEERKRAEEALQLAKNELEERVEQRTQELRSINKQLTAELARRELAEQALEEERALLALRVEERTSELSAANMELAKAAEMKDAFLASMSHELRTPLSAILNLSETLLETLYGPLTAEQEKSLRTIQQSGEHLLVLINDILDLSKIGAGKLDLTLDEVSVEMLCQASVQFVREAARKKQLAISTTIDPQVKTVWADPRRMKQVLINLLNNAVKFTPERGSIGLSVTGDPELKRVSFTVWDTGIGIPPEKMKLLFKPFIQLDNRLARQYEGTGLGLAMVYKLVELHNGGISLESEPGLGSRFTVSLKWQEQDDEVPVSKVEPEQDLLTTPVNQGVGTDITMQFRRCLDEINVRAVGYWYEKEAVLKAIETGCDLFVLDVRLLSQGLELFSLLKNAAEQSGTPLMILAHHNASQERPILPASVTYLDYPFSAQEVRRTIRAVSPQGTASLVRRVAVFVERSLAGSERRPMILLTEDNPLSARIYSDFLIAMGYRVSFAASGTEAIERAREISPDLIMMDIQMPGMDGIEATQRIRKDAQLKGIPIIAVTDLLLPGDCQRCQEAGADEFLCKPLSFSKLDETIRDQLIKHGKSIPLG